MLGWYDAIVAAVTEVTAGGEVPDAGRAAFADLRAAIEPVLDREPGSSVLAAAGGEAGGLERREVVSNAAVMLFGGIETTEGMIANAVLHLLSAPRPARAGDGRPGPAAQRHRGVAAAGAGRGDGRPVRDDRRDAGRRRDPPGRARQRLGRGGQPRPGDVPRPRPLRRAAARTRASTSPSRAGPHVCIGMHLARLEAHTAVGRLLDRLPGVRLDPARPSAPAGLVFRKPPALHVLWSTKPD